MIDQVPRLLEEGLAPGRGVGAVTELHLLGRKEKSLQRFLRDRGQTGALAGEAGEEFLGGLVADGVAETFSEVVFQGLGDGKGEGIGSEFVAPPFDRLEFTSGPDRGAGRPGAGIAVSEEKEHQPDETADEEEESR